VRAVMVEQLLQLCLELHGSGSSSSKLVIIRAMAGHRAFCAGGDIRNLAMAAHRLRRYQSSHAQIAIEHCAHG